jgi:hypothetical protein
MLKVKDKSEEEQLVGRLNDLFCTFQVFHIVHKINFVIGKNKRPIIFYSIVHTSTVACNKTSKVSDSKVFFGTWA